MIRKTRGPRLDPKESVSRLTIVGPVAFTTPALDGLRTVAGDRGAVCSERTYVHLVALAHVIVGVDLCLQPVDPGLHIRDVDPLECGGAAVPVTVTGGNSLGDARAVGSLSPQLLFAALV